MGSITSQITSLTIVYSIVHSDADQRKHQSSASLAFVRGIHRVPVNSPHKWPVTRKMLPFDDVIMVWRILFRFQQFILWFLFSCSVKWRSPKLALLPQSQRHIGESPCAFFCCRLLFWCRCFLWRSSSWISRSSPKWRESRHFNNSHLITKLLKSGTSQQGKWPDHHHKRYNLMKLGWLYMLNIARDQHMPVSFLLNITNPFSCLSRLCQDTLMLTVVRQLICLLMFWKMYFSAILLTPLIVTWWGTLNLSTRYFVIPMLTNQLVISPAPLCSHYPGRNWFARSRNLR